MKRFSFFDNRTTAPEVSQITGTLPCGFWDNSEQFPPFLYQYITYRNLRTPYTYHQTAPTYNQTLPFFFLSTTPQNELIISSTKRNHQHKCRTNEKLKPKPQNNTTIYQICFLLPVQHITRWFRCTFTGTAWHQLSNTGAKCLCSFHYCFS